MVNIFILILNFYIQSSAQVNAIMRAQERFDLEDAQKSENRNRNGEKSRPEEFVVTRFVVIITITIFVFLLCAAVLITYNFGICSNINVQSEVCDKKNVIPITIAINNTQPVDDGKKSVRFQEDLHRSNRTNVRLPRTMHPISYELKLTPFLFVGNFTFNGDVRIKVNVTKSCRNVTLHAIALKISDVSVWKIGNGTQTDASLVDISDKYAIEPDQFFVIIFPTELEANNTYEINIKYTGVLNDILQGFYRSSYEVDNTTR